MNKIDRIIRESIDRFILREINEAKWASMNDMEKPKKATVINSKTGEKKIVINPNSPKGKDELFSIRTGGEKRIRRGYTRRPSPTSVAEVCTIYEMSKPRKAKWISKLIRNEWSSPGLENVITFNRRSSVDFGLEDREKLDGAIRKKISRNDTPNPSSPVATETVNSFQKVSSLYHKLNELTSNIEKWGADGDYNGIESEITKMPQTLDDLSIWLGNLYNDINDNKDKINPNTQRVGNIRTGYKRKTGGQAIKGTDQIFGNKSNFNKIQIKLSNCAEMIREYFGDFYGEGKNDNGPIEMNKDVDGVKMIRR